MRGYLSEEEERSSSSWLVPKGRTGSGGGSPSLFVEEWKGGGGGDEGRRPWKWRSRTFVLSHPSQVYDKARLFVYKALGICCGMYTTIVLQWNPLIGRYSTLQKNYPFRKIVVWSMCQKLFKINFQIARNSTVDTSGVCCTYCCCLEGLFLPLPPLFFLSPFDKWNPPMHTFPFLPSPLSKSNPNT